MDIVVFARTGLSCHRHTCHLSNTQELGFWSQDDITLHSTVPMTVSIEHVKIKHVYIQTEYRVHNTGDMSCEHTVMNNTHSYTMLLLLGVHTVYIYLLISSHLIKKDSIYVV